MGWWCAKRWPGARTAWCGGLWPKRCCKRVPASGWPPSRRSMRPSLRNARSESARPGADLVAVDQGSLLIVGWALSSHPNDAQEAEPTLATIPSAIGIPEAAALDAGYAGPATLTACEKRGIEPYIATGRDPHHPSWQQRFAPLPDPPPEEASSQVKMAYKRHRPPWAKPSTAHANARLNRCICVRRRWLCPGRSMPLEIGRAHV